MIAGRQWILALPALAPGGVGQEKNEEKAKKQVFMVH